jgi:hypothetical protein
MTITHTIFDRGMMRVYITFNFLNIQRRESIRK